MFDTAFTHFFGEREERFCITPGLIPELERVTNAGIGTLFKRVAANEFRHADIIHTIRLGMIGGGATPDLAARICAVYADPRPISETLPIALAILERLWFGGPVADVLVAEIKRAAANG